MSLRKYDKIILKTCRQCYCSSANVENVDTTSIPHPYCNPPFRNYVELTEFLVENVIHNSSGNLDSVLLAYNRSRIFLMNYYISGLLILNRPHGLKKHEPTERGFWLKRIKLNLSPSLQSTDKLTFTGVLPYLKKRLQLPDLQLLKAPDRFLRLVCE